MREPDRIDTDTKVSRTIDYVWSLPDRPWEGEEDPSRTEVYLHVAHWKERKQYYASLTRRGVTGRVHISHIAPGESVIIAQEPTARYSAKQLAYFAAQAYFTLEASQDERVAALMEGRNWRES